VFLKRFSQYGAHFSVYFVSRVQYNSNNNNNNNMAKINTKFQYFYIIFKFENCLCLKMYLLQGFGSEIRNENEGKYCRYVHY
jgi:hypothetical protein